LEILLDYSAMASVQQRDGSPEYFSQFEARTCRRNHWFDPKIQQTPRISLVAQILLGVVLGFHGHVIIFVITSDKLNLTSCRSI
jgi:hypothetical protein